MSALLHNRMLLSAVLAWLTAQIVKTILYAAVNHKLDWQRLFGDGGMPSGHSATVTALAVSAALVCGLDSAAFAVSAVLAIVVMHDAMGVRLEAGKHARAINELMELLGSSVAPEEKLQEFLGHTPMQVVLGALLGAAVAFVMP